jgi:hypothetical protein
VVTIMHRALMTGTLLSVLLLGSPLGAQESDQAPKQSNDKSLNSPESDAFANEAMQTESGQAGTDMPGVRALRGTKDPEPLFKNGVWNITGVPTGSAIGSQRPPAKLSEETEALYRFHVPLDERRRAILSDMLNNAPNVQGIDPVFQEQLPVTITLNDLPPAAAEYPRLQGLKYIRVADRIVFVDSTNRRVVGEVRAIRQSR